MTARVPGGVIVVHAEDGDIVDTRTKALRATGRQDLAAWDESRPTFCEGDAVLRAIYLAKKADSRVCIAHLSSNEGLDAARTMRYGKTLLETCPHYLALHTDLPLGPLGKVAPPLRGPSHVEALWEAVAAGEIHFVGSDHNPWLRDSKQELWNGLAGMAGIALIWPVLYTEGCAKRGIPIERMVNLAATNAAKAFGLYHRKGVIAVGADADLVVLDTGIQKRLTYSELNSCVDYSPFEGYMTAAWPWVTVVRGQVAYENGELQSVRPGQVLLAGDSLPL